LSHHEKLPVPGGFYQMHIGGTSMRKFLTAAAAAAAIFTFAGSANALPAGQAPEGVSPLSNVALCFYTDGWNGAGMYECGFRHKRGHGWHGKRSDRHGERHNERHSERHGDKHQD
jgi:hypothetical protein